MGGAFGGSGKRTKSKVGWHWRCKKGTAGKNEKLSFLEDHHAHMTAEMHTPEGSQFPGPRISVGEGCGWCSPYPGTRLGGRCLQEDRQRRDTSSQECVPLFPRVFRRRGGGVDTDGGVASEGGLEGVFGGGGYINREF